MRIAICGSMVFSQDMLDAKKVLEEKGFEVALPDGVEEYISDPSLTGKLKDTSSAEDAKRKIERDLIKRHYNEIKESDAILVINKEKKGIEGYVGGNSFLEMGFAHVLGKKIFTLYDVSPKQEHIYQELVAMQPIVLNEDINKIEL